MTELKTEGQYERRQGLLRWFITGIFNWGQRPKLFNDSSEDATSGQPHQRLRNALRENTEFKANNNSKLT